MTLKISINMDNAAFSDGGEIGRILRELAERTEFGSRDDISADVNGLPLIDANGNRVGKVTVTGR